MTEVILIAIGIAVSTWFIADILKLWFPERYERIKRSLSLRKALKPEENRHHSPAERLRDAALQLAVQSLQNGKSLDESIGTAIEHIRRRTKVWRNEDELRGWLERKLSERSNNVATKSRLMKIENLRKPLFVGLIAGFIVGICAGVIATRFLFYSDDFSVQIMNHATAIKTNKRTGETWIMNRDDGVWQSTKTAPEN